MADHPLTAASPERGGREGTRSVIQPNGDGLPAGRGTALEGAPIFRADCALCHGYDLQGGGSAPRLATPPVDSADAGSDPPRYPRILGVDGPTAPSLFDFIRRMMPYNRPGALTDSETYAVTAYILARNGIIAEDQVVDAESLRRIQMPGSVEASR